MKPKEKEAAEEVQSLIEIIKKGVEKYGSYSALKAALFSTIQTKDKHSEEINRVIELVCEDYSVSRKLLLGSQRGVVSEARELAWCILHLELGLTTRYIACDIWGKKKNNHILIWHAVQKYRRLNANIKSDAEFGRRYDRVWEKYKTKKLNHEQSSL